MSRLNIVAALRCEADPLVRAFDLHRLEASGSGHVEGNSGGHPGGNRPFQIFSGPGVSLIVSGVGKLASAAATAYLGGLAGGGKGVAWLNVGCGGAARRPVGSAYLAESVRDRETGKAWYPALLLDTKLETAPVTTISHVEQDYPGESIYEMEAAGFFSAAIRFSTLELVHVVKVISDNRDSSVDRVDADLISGLIEDRVAEVEDVADRLLSLAGDLNARACEPERIEAFLHGWRFTFSQRAMLRRCLERGSAYGMDSEFRPQGFEASKSAREVLARMETKLSEAPVRLT